MKKILSLILMAMMSLCALAQEVQPFEGEICGGITYPTASWESNDGIMSDNGSKIGYEIGIEGRYNFKRLPLDVGLRIDNSAAHRKDMGHEWGGQGSSGRYYDRTASWRTTCIAAVCDYNFYDQSSTTFFAGLGLGAGYLYDGGNEDIYRAVFIPRIGVEVSQFLRFTLDAHISKKYFNTVGLSLGLVVGGHKRNR